MIKYLFRQLYFWVWIACIAITFYMLHSIDVGAISDSFAGIAFVSFGIEVLFVMFVLLDSILHSHSYSYEDSDDEEDYHYVQPSQSQSDPKPRRRTHKELWADIQASIEKARWAAPINRTGIVYNEPGRGGITIRREVHDGKGGLKSVSQVSHEGK